MAIAQVAHRASAVHNETDPATSLTVTIPSSVVAGDILIVACVLKATVGTGTSVTDDDTGGNAWTALVDVNDGTNTYIAYWKRATAETAGKTVTIVDPPADAATSMAAGLSAYSGALEAGHPFGGSILESNASGDETSAGLTTHTRAGHMILFFVWNAANDNLVTSQTCTNPGTLVQRFEATSAASTDCAVNHSSEVQTTHGATGNITWAQTNAATASLATSLRPAIFGAELGHSMHPGRSPAMKGGFTETVQSRRAAPVTTGVVFRKTLSPVGTGTGKRQQHNS